MHFNFLRLKCMRQLSILVTWNFWNERQLTFIITRNFFAQNCTELFPNFWKAQKENLVLQVPYFYCFWRATSSKSQYCTALELRPVGSVLMAQKFPLLPLPGSNVAQKRCSMSRDTCYGAGTISLPLSLHISIKVDRRSFTPLSDGYE